MKIMNKPNDDHLMRVDEVSTLMQTRSKAKKLEIPSAMYKS